MNVKSVVEKDCCGCSACCAVCPVNAINMVEDEHGFLRPVIDESICISCGICLKVCSNKKQEREQSIRAYAARSNDENVLKKSSSGGVAYEFAKRILADGGVVYGVVYDEQHEACHARIDSLDNCPKLFGSKYVQSNPKKTLRQVYDDLKEGKQVLYFGILKN